MHSVTTKKAALAALLVLAALLSVFAVGKRASDPAYHQASIDALAEKQETVLELTAASTAASAAITLLPGDTATPIAEKLADLSGYFLIVLCAIFLEKYLLTITSYVSFTILIPAACALGIAALFSEKLRAALGKLAWHLLLFALAIAFAIPAGVKVSSMIEDTYRASIEETIANAEQTTEDIQTATSGELRGAELGGRDLAVNVTVFHQLFMRADAHGLAAVEHDDLVCVADGADALRDDDLRRVVQLLG